MGYLCIFFLQFQQENVITPNPIITGVKRSRPDDNSQLDLNGNTTNTDVSFFFTALFIIVQHRKI